MNHIRRDQKIFVFSSVIWTLFIICCAINIKNTYSAEKRLPSQRQDRDNPKKQRITTPGEINQAYLKDIEELIGILQSSQAGDLTDNVKKASIEKINNFNDLEKAREKSIFWKRIIKSINQAKTKEDTQKIIAELTEEKKSVLSPEAHPNQNSLTITEPINDLPSSHHITPQNSSNVYPPAGAAETPHKDYIRVLNDILGFLGPNTYQHQEAYRHFKSHLNLMPPGENWKELLSDLQNLQMMQGPGQKGYIELRRKITQEIKEIIDKARDKQSSASIVTSMQPLHQHHHQIVPASIPEGWNLRFAPKFKIHDFQFDSTHIHKKLKTLMNEIDASHFTYQNMYKGGRESSVNALLANIEIVLKSKDGKYFTINSDIIFPNGKGVIFQSGCQKPKSIENYEVINGNTLINPISNQIQYVNTLYQQPASLIDKQLYTVFSKEIEEAQRTVENGNLGSLFGDDRYADLYGHSEQFLISTVLNKEFFREQVHNILSMNVNSLSENCEIVSIILHLHSYYDLCQRCSVTLVKQTEFLNTDFTKDFGMVDTYLSYNLLENANYIRYCDRNDSHEYISNDDLALTISAKGINIQPTTKIFIVASSQENYKDRRITMNNFKNDTTYRDRVYNVLIDIINELSFMIQLDPQTNILD